MALHLFKPTLAPLTLRLGLAVVVCYHGLAKLLSNGGRTWLEGFGVPEDAQMAIAWVEFISGLMIALGLVTRLAAVAVIAIQVGAIYFVTGPRDFISLQHVTTAPQRYRFGEVGWEYNFVLIVMALTLVLLGSGTWSLNNLFLSRLRRTSAAPEPSATAPVTH
jgi:putative oxidoreductase